MFVHYCECTEHLTRYISPFQPFLQLVGFAAGFNAFSIDVTADMTYDCSRALQQPLCLVYSQYQHKFFHAFHFQASVV